MADPFQKEIYDVEILTKMNVVKLTQIWNKMFPIEMCKDNLCKLARHIQIFFDDLVTESEEKKANVEKEINDLKCEAENLRRLLKTEVELPCVGPEAPLIMWQSELDKSLRDLRECLRQRREEICELLLQQEAFCEELGLEPRPLLEDPLPSEDEIVGFRSHLKELQSVRLSRLNDLSILRREIKNYLQILELKVNTDAEDRLLNDRQIKLNEDTFNGLRRMQQRFGAQVEEVRERIDSMREKLEKLWDRLNTTKNTRNKFAHLNDYTQKTFDIYYNEVQRCEALKSQNIKLYVHQLRDQITQWWDKTLKSKVEQNRFSNFHSNCYTDDLLVLHEMELDDLQSYYETNQEIFELFENRKILWERMTALENKATEPGRYNNRGGQLLKEEKERKTIATKLPKIEQKITELVKEYEVREHRPFLVYGENIIDVMSNEWEKKRQDKEQRTSARKNAQTTLSVTRTPMSIKNSSVASIKKTPSVTNLTGTKVASSLKRKMANTEKVIPTAKRSLMQAMNSPSVFLKPGTSNGISAKKQAFKSPMKKLRVLSSTINRNPNRNSGSNKKRRSVKKCTKTSGTPNKPQIIVTEHVDEQSDDFYKYFENNIEPAHRSSVIHSKSGPVISERSKDIRHQQPTEAARLITLPKPRNLRTPSKPNVKDISSLSHRSSPHSPANIMSSRKLTTKNLPIII
ncbi:protein regulator of cytokinesis 1-like [Teleopsis dalmanni]|uniref:protein regulator of cytokinesis 1-like n=1 Tax=Teleopsis dalmanni TaxID=139649 RepID=UPI0018CD86CB|nr:protein regulator of cytokinesis 1-like [Teleopsis dalmanni]